MRYRNSCISKKRFCRDQSTYPRSRQAAWALITRFARITLQKKKLSYSHLKYCAGFFMLHDEQV